MIPKSAELAAMSDDELKARYDREAEHTVVGTEFYLDELSRRANDRQVDTVRVLTKQMRDMTVAIVILTLVNVILVAASLR